MPLSLRTVLLLAAASGSHSFSASGDLVTCTRRRCTQSAVLLASHSDDIAEKQRLAAESRRLEAETARAFELSRRRKFGYAKAKDFISTRPLDQSESEGLPFGTPPDFGCTSTQLLFPDGEESGFWFNELMHEDKIVGRLHYILDSPDEVAQLIQNTYHISIAEMRDMSVLKHLRGYSGGEALVSTMVDALVARKVQFILLRSADRGNGRLHSYFERFGFEFARQALPLPVSPRRAFRAGLVAASC